MKVLGIVAEYNPFHKGHSLHIEESKKAVSRETAIVCVMSGDFVQRGEAAVFSKFARAEAAVRGGADLVLELPLPWSLSSAEGFARGAVGILGSLGCVDYLSFGSECGDMNILNTLATAMMEPSLDNAIKQELSTGISYAAARQIAISKDIGSLSEYLETPNNILAVEYLKALYTQRLRMEPITVQRIGAGHDMEGGSASDLRTMLKIDRSIKHYVPHDVLNVFRHERDQGRGPVTMDALETAIISRLRLLSEEDFASVPDAAEGLENRLCDAAHEESTLDGISAAAKSKRYALSRIRRMCMCAALGIKQGQAEGIPPFARVLAANKTGMSVLKIISDKATIPVITKPATVKELPIECRHLFEQGSAAHDLYVLGYTAKEERRGNADWRASPRII